MTKKIQLFVKFETVMSSFKEQRPDNEAYGNVCSVELKENNMIPNTREFLLNMLEETPDICLIVFDKNFIFREGIDKLVTDEEEKDVEELRKQFLEHGLMEIK